MSLSYTHQALKDLKRLPKTIQQRALSGAESIHENPLIGKKLQGPLTAYRSLRIGEYRIVYQVSAKPKQVIIMTIAPRGRAYQ